MSERSVTIEHVANGYVVIVPAPIGTGHQRLIAETIKRAVELAALNLNHYPIGTRVKVRIVEPEGRS